MNHTTRLVAVGLVLAALVIASLLIFTGEPDAVRPGAEEPPTGAEPAVADRVAEAPTPPAEPDTAVNRQPVEQRATTGSLSVQVRWSQGAAAPGVLVWFRTATRFLPKLVLRQETSDQQGRIRVDGLPAGPLSLRADRGGGLRVDVIAGVHGECELVLPAGIEVRGLVTDPLDRPVADAGVWLQTEHTNWWAGSVIARTAADGTFALSEIPPGLSLGAVADGYAPSPLLDLDTVDTSSPPVDLRLVLEDGAGAVEGEVRDRSGGGIEGAIVAVGETPSHLNLRGGEQWIEAWTARPARSEPEGRFAVVGVETGTWPVAVRADGFGIWRTRVDVVAGERVWLDVVLDRDATVAGIVTDPIGEPIVGATVRAFDTMPGTSFIQCGQIGFDETFGHVGTQTGEDGHYRLEGVTPGEVHLFAQAKRTPRLDETFPFVREVIEVEPGSELGWNPVLGPGRTIEGVVLYRDGRPMGYVFLTAMDEQGGPQHTLINDPEGRFRFVCLEGATYSLHVQYSNPREDAPPLEKAGVVPNQGLVELRAPFDKPVEGPKGSVSGRIEDAGGRLTHQKELRVLLVSDRGWWRTQPEIDGRTFRFADVEPGRYRAVALAGEDAIAQRDWFDLGDAEDLDLGVLTTEPPGTLVIKLDRGPGTLELTPMFILSLDGWSRGSQVDVGRSSEVRLENLTAGTYRVRGYAAGMANLRGEVEVRVGQVAELRFAPEPATPVRFELWFPQGRDPGTASTKIVGADGAVLHEFERTHGKTPPRPYRTRVHVPRGRWTIAVTTDTGLAGMTEFTVGSIEREYPVVRVHPK